MKLLFSLLADWHLRREDVNDRDVRKRHRSLPGRSFDQQALRIHGQVRQLHQLSN